VKAFRFRIVAEQIDGSWKVAGRRSRAAFVTAGCASILPAIVGG
jgi:hypothetical protein